MRVRVAVLTLEGMWSIFSSEGVVENGHALTHFFISERKFIFFKEVRTGLFYKEVAID